MDCLHDQVVFWREDSVFVTGASSRGNNVCVSVGIFDRLLCMEGESLRAWDEFCVMSDVVGDTRRGMVSTVKCAFSGTCVSMSVVGRVHCGEW